MNRRNIIAGSRTVRLIRTPAALIYHAVLCCIFAVSLSIIHETQIPFTFFRDFLKKVFGALSVSQSSTASGLNLSVTGFAVTAPLVGEPLAGRRVFGVWRFAPFGSAGVMFTSAAEVALGADRLKDLKMKLMPRPPLLGNDDDRRQRRKQGGVVGAAASRVRVHLHEATAGSRNPDRWHRASAMMTERFSPSSRSRW